jgi:ABC-type lipoprotein export system ATPase subunit
MNQTPEIIKEPASSSLFANEDIILRVRDLHTYFFTDLGIARALNGVNFDIPRGKVMGVVGESGCGKSVTALSIMRMVTRPGRIIQGKITLFRRDQNSEGKVVEEIDLTSLEPNGPKIRSLRGEEMAMIFQEPMTSLNPSYTIGDQIMEGIILHQNVDKVEAEKRAVEILDRVGMANSKVLFNPMQSPAVVKSSNHVVAEVRELREMLGIESGRESAEARRWKEAAAERWDTARATGAQGVDSVKHFGSETRGQARSMKNKFAEKIAERKLRRHEDDE